MRLPKRLLCLLLLTLGVPRGAAAQSSPADQARQLLEDGRQYFAKGQIKQALDNFNTIVSGFGTTDVAPLALLEIGRYHAEVEGNVDKGREAFEQVAQRFPQSEGAPGAYYNLGMLTLNRAGTAAELDDALAQFTRVQRLYPRSEWVPRALQASGLVQRKLGKLADAVDVARRVALEYPSSEAAPAAQFQIGDCLALQAEFRLAMEEYQQVRSRYPASEWAAPAFDRITALYRLFGTAKPTFAPDPSFTVSGGDILKDVRAILMTPSRTLWVATDKSKAAIPFDPAGKIGAGIPAEDLRSLGLSPRGDLVTAARLAVRVGPKEVKTFQIPSDKPGFPEPLERITAAALTRSSFLVADEKKKRVFRFDLQLQAQGTFPDAKEREIVRILLDGEGAVVLLDREARAAQVYDESGKLLRTIGPRGAGFELKRPVDIAVDPFRNTYIADEEGGVYVFSAQGQLLTALSGEEIRKPKAITLDPAGAILVYDERSQRIVRYR